MKRNLLILLVACVLFAVSASAAAAQTYNRIGEKTIKPTKGKKLIVKGEVRDSDEIAYRFKTRGGQKITIKIIGRDAEFSFYAIGEFDAEPLAEEKQSWTGTLPATNDERWEIVVHSNYKVADFRLEITLK